jgi:oligoribonuclease
MDTLDKMVWVDLESTGLDADNEIMLEVGVCVTDLEGAILGGIKSLIYHPNAEVYLSQAVPVVQEMHRKSGLWTDITDLLFHQTENPSAKLDVTMSATAVGDMLVVWLEREMGLAPSTYPMCGSTINFDRSFLVKHMPILHDWFHYRNVDISSLKMLCSMLNPAVYAQKPRGDAAHRVIEDMNASVAEYQFYLDNFLMVHLPDVFAPDNPLDTVDVAKLEAALADQPETAQRIVDFLNDPSTGTVFKRPAR